MDPDKSAFLKVLALVLPFAAGSALAAEPATKWTTLGTASGPNAHVDRAQPANLLRFDDEAILVDAGEGVTDQLGKAGLQPKDVHTIFISHLHFDHTGGLFGFLGRRFMLRSDGDVTVYGPPGTKDTINGLIAAMQPIAGITSWLSGKPGDNVKVVEMVEGSRVTVGKAAVTSTVNTHFSQSGDGKTLSLSYRFDLPDRSIVYTGDTGVSDNIERLAKGADLLVSEVMDVDDEMSNIRKLRPELNLVSLWLVKRHFAKEHLQPEEAGLMAKHAGVKALLLTHIAMNSESLDKARQAIAANFGGPITFASDLKSY